MTKKKVVKSTAKAKPTAKKKVKVPAKELDMFKKAGVKSIRAGGTQFDLVSAPKKKAAPKKKVALAKSSISSKLAKHNKETEKVIAKSVAKKVVKPVLSKTVENTKKIQAIQFKVEVAAAKALIAQQTKFHLEQVLATTGKILQVDKAYCKDLGNRILAKKFPTLKLKM